MNHNLILISIFPCPRDKYILSDNTWYITEETVDLRSVNGINMESTRIIIPQKLYETQPSLPSGRSVLITAKALGVNFTLKEMDKHLKPECLKKNSQHTFPTHIEEDNFTQYISHSIIRYLSLSHDKNDSLYPKDLKKRAVVDQRLHFELEVAFVPLKNIVFDILHHGKKTIDQADEDSVNEVYGNLELLLGDQQWIAGDSVTVADYSLFTCITSENVLVPIDAQKYPKVAAWLKRVEQLPEAQANKEGLGAFEKMIKDRLSS